MPIRCVLLCSLAILLADCSQIREPPCPPPPPSILTVRMLPIIVAEDDGDHDWTNLMLNTQQRYADLVWQEAQVQFRFLPAHTIRRGAWRQVDGIHEVYEMALTSKMLADTNGILVIWLVQSIHLGEKYAGGLSATPYFLNTMVSHGVWVVQGAAPSTLAHELGHSFGLMHTWDDTHSDTPTQNREDCESDTCNVMNYCPPCWSRDPHLSREQIEYARGWLSRPPRSRVVE